MWLPHIKTHHILCRSPEQTLYLCDYINLAAHVMGLANDALMSAFGYECVW